MIKDNSTSAFRVSTLSIEAKIFPITLLIFLSILIFRSSFYHSTLILGTDLFWHLEYGKYFINHLALPKTDWLSWTAFGTPYQITQWLGELILAISVYFGGSAALSFTVAATGCLTLFFAWRTAAIYLCNPVLSLLVALVTIFPVFTMNARPQLFGFAAFAALVWVLAEWFTHKSKWTLVAMSLIMGLWVNFHGSFIVGVAYIAALGGGAWLFTFIEMRGRFIDSVRVHLPLAIASFTAIFATLVNPYGWRAFESVLMISQLKTTRTGVISEWVATSLSTAHGEIFFIILFGIFVAMLMAEKRPGINTIIGFIGTVYFGLSSDRQVFFALIALVPFLSNALKGSKIETLFNAKSSLNVNIITASFVFIFVSAISVFFQRIVEMQISATYDEVYPRKAMAFLNENHLNGNIFNKAEFGGYIGSLGRKVFIDSRLDLFGDDMVLGTMDATNGKPGWSTFLAKYNPDLFILNNSDPLKELILTKSDCKLIYSDNFHSVIKCSLIPIS